jgi:integrase
MSRRTRRIRSPHPGVKLNARTLPSGRVQWRARYVDPDTGKQTDCTLDPGALPTAEARTLWAKQKAQALAKRRMQLEAGAERFTVTPLQAAVNDYLAAAKHRLRPNTVAAYKLASARLLQWAARAGIDSTAELTRGSLTKLREHLIAAPRKTAAAEGRRGARREGARRRAPVSVNMELRGIKTILGGLRLGGLLPQLDSDAIGDALKALPVPREQPTYLTPAKLQKLLQAVQRHDAAAFAETRAEHAGLRPKGSTRRYESIAPFTAFLLLTGCRRGEALGLTWADVDLDAVDSQGNKVGEIRLRAEHTKTHQARTIGLEVSPALHAMLAAMKLRAGKNADALHVFGSKEPYTVDLVESTRQRLMREYGAPSFDWQALRSTCATYLTNAPGIFGAATVFMSARQLGHSVTVAERHYLGVHRGIPKDAHALEAAMQIEDALADVSKATSGRRALTRLPRENNL